MTGPYHPHVNPLDFHSSEDYEAACDEASRGPATPSEARAEYAANAGAEQPDRQWILTPWDTWERNPRYSGPEQRHPEDDHPDADDNSLVAAVKLHARNNYESDGWDIVLECWSDAEVLAVVNAANANTAAEAIAAVAAEVGPLAEHRDEVRAEIF